MTSVDEVHAVAEGRASELRSAMVKELRDLGHVVSEPVAAAVAKVDRHLFAPGEPLEAVYAVDNALRTKADAAGRSTSSVSATYIQAAMLEQAGIRPGMRVLEIGTGGYNAALIRELVGESGHVVSLDIDPDIVARAHACLKAAGYGHLVEVVTGDGAAGVPSAAPFDRIIVTAGAHDIPAAWVEQLTEDGRLVVPLRLRGLTRSFAFDRVGDRLVSRSYRLAGFVPMQGGTAHAQRVEQLDEQAVLRIDEDGEDVDVPALSRALHGGPVLRWSGAVFDLPDEQELWIAGHAPAFGVLHAGPGLIERGVLAPSTAFGAATFIKGGGFAFRTKREVADAPGTFESGVYAYGPDAEQLAAEFVDLLRTWARDHLRRDAARVEIFPRDTPDAELPAGLVVDKPLSRVVLSWP
jgi:protein-L-isoaspartate(D-aspartate) O-methyltransferase